MAPAQELVDRFGRALSFQGDRTVVAVAHPAGEAELLGAMSATGAVADSLDSTANHCRNATLTHRGQPYFESCSL